MNPGITRLVLAGIVCLSHFSSLAVGGPAVACFFALSGYWIAGLWRQQTGEGLSRYTHFVSARWLRLAPLLVLALAGQALISIVFHRTDVPLSSVEWWLRQLGIASSTPAGLLLPQQWSLDVEMRFYLVAPLLGIAFGLIRGRQAWLLAVVAFAAGITMISSGHPVISGELMPHLGFFLAGMAFHHTGGFTLPRWLPWTCLAAIVFLLALPQVRYLLNSELVTTGSPAHDLQQQSLLVMLLGLLALPLTLPSVLRPSSKLDRLLGDLAYPVYLFHWWFRTIVYEIRGEDADAVEKAMLAATALAATAVVSVLFLIVIDRPVQRWRRTRVPAAATAGSTSLPSVKPSLYP